MQAVPGTATTTTAKLVDFASLGQGSQTDMASLPTSMGELYD